MKKRNLKLFTAIIAVALVAGGIIFYACKKEENLTKEASFVAKNYDGSCVQVDIFRDEHNNARFVTKNVDKDTNLSVFFIVSDALDIAPYRTKDDASYVFCTPNDAIYWLVPLDGNEPIKFESLTEGAKVPQGNCASVTCTGCDEWTTNCSGNQKCNKVHYSTGKCGCEPATGSCCTRWGCQYQVKVETSEGIVTLVGSTYLIQSNTITINGITYE
jgi:hypothetical protein